MNGNYFMMVLLKKTDFENIETIGPFAINSNILKTVYIPDNVKDIDTGAFYNCSNLESIYLTECVYLKEVKNLEFFDEKIKKILNYRLINVLRICVSRAKLQDKNSRAGVLRTSVLKNTFHS